MQSHAFLGDKPITITRSSAVVKTARVLQIEGMFDIPPSQRSGEQWAVNLKLPERWNVGLIVGPSGAGKSTVARELFGEQMARDWEWPADKSLLDGFPADMSVKDIVELLSSVGFSSPPSWVRPFNVLSNGEQFRVNMARTLAEMKSLAVVDEFTSVVDRNVARIGSAAIAKTVRSRDQQFVAVTCHYDVADWLEPDWVYQPHTNTFAVGRSLRRPDIQLTIGRVHNSAWALFRKHHYLDSDLNKAANCFCAFWNGVPVAFCAVLHFPHPTVKNVKREHRVVCLPDFQGVGIGNALSAYVGGMLKALGYRYQSQTSHPGMIAARNRSRKWHMYQKPTHEKPKPGKNSSIGSGWMQSQRTRLVAGFEYVGPAIDRGEARLVWGN